MHGLGNDFIVVDGVTRLFSEEAGQKRASPNSGNPPASNEAAIDRSDTPSLAEMTALAPALCDRHFGIGADGLIVIMPSVAADFRMHYVNADGSIAAMCGNGVRCVGKFVFEHGLWERDTLALETGSGILELELSIIAGSVAGVTVDMGSPDFSAASLPAIAPDGERLIDEKIAVGAEHLAVTGVSMGNPHCVHFIEQNISVADYPVERIGPRIENLMGTFPERVNAGFAKVLAPDRMELRVWERGCGETLACGSGACAAVAAGIVTGRIEPGKPIAVRLHGGTLEISWSGKSDDGMRMFGPAVTVFEGAFDTKTLCD